MGRLVDSSAFQDHVHLRLPSEPASRDVPILGRIKESDLEISVDLNDDFGNLHHSKIFANAVARARTKLDALTSSAYLSRQDEAQRTVKRFRRILEIT